ncbi:unnamed protein product [Diamesa hyperborea]
MRLPSPQKLSHQQVMFKWDPQNKNPGTVEGYGVFWHSADFLQENFTNSVVNGLGKSRLDAKETSITIDGLKHNILYELFVKAGNHFDGSDSNGVILGGIFAGILAIALLVIVAAFLYMKTKKLQNKSAANVAFESIQVI